MTAADFDPPLPLCCSPPKIKSVKILDNPFDDIVIRITAAERRKQEARRRESAREREEMAGRKKVKK